MTPIIMSLIRTWNYIENNRKASTAVLTRVPRIIQPYNVYTPMSKIPNAVDANETRSKSVNTNLLWLPPVAGSLFTRT